MKSDGPVTVLVIDDSAVNRRAISQMLESAPGVVVVDRASDGEEGLKKAAALRPDVITLDLEMPKLDGFSFLRLLMARVPTPVIVISSYAHKSDVFKALELGAFDFIAKPARPDKDQLTEIRTELLEKVRAVRLIRASAKRRDTPRAVAVPRTTRVVAVGASTGGPPAVQRLIEALSGQAVCLLISQHMPAQFTRAFADRLDRIGHLRVTEGRQGDLVKPGHAYIAPGGRHMRLVSNAGALHLEISMPVEADKHVPSVDFLFTSVAKAVGAEALAVVLTGMGADGAKGAVAVRGAGGTVWAESEETAVIFGMPKEAIAAGGVTRVLPLHEIGPGLIEVLAKKG